MRKTDDNVILKMLNEGKSQKEIAEYFGVSPAAICKRVKKIATQKSETFESLTEKEQQFALSIADGKSQTQAAMESHDCSTRDSAKSMGYQLMKKNDIRTAVGELMQRHGLTRGYRVQKLKNHVDHADPNVSLKALDQSWKLDHAYTETPEERAIPIGFHQIVIEALERRFGKSRLMGEVKEDPEIIDGEFEEEN